MSTTFQFQGDISGIAEGMPFGPLRLFILREFTQMAITEITLGALSTRQIIGGASPAIFIPSVSLLFVQPEDTITLAIQNADITTEGVTLVSRSVFFMSQGSITELRLRNAGAAETTAIVMLG